MEETVFIKTLRANSDKCRNMYELCIKLGIKNIGGNTYREIKKIGKVDLLLPEAGSLERASTYRDKKIKPLFIKMKNYVATMAAKVLEVTEELEKWKNKYQRLKIDYNNLQKDVDETWEYCNRLSADKERLQIISDRHDRVMRVLGKSIIDAAVQKDIQMEKALEEKQRREHTPQGIHDRLKWGKERSEINGCLRIKDSHFCKWISIHKIQVR